MLAALEWRQFGYMRGKQRKRVPRPLRYLPALMALITQPAHYSRRSKIQLVPHPRLLHGSTKSWPGSLCTRRKSAKSVAPFVLQNEANCFSQSRSGDRRRRVPR
jgi:hypothetical protein